MRVMIDVSRAAGLDHSLTPDVVAGLLRRRRGAGLAFVFALWAASAFGQTRPSVRARGRPGRQGRGVGADAAGAGREDARHGEGDRRRLRDGPRLGRRPQRHRRRQARGPSRRRRVQPRHGGARRRGWPTEAGVADRATFVEGDMFTADISKATVMALFLLPSNLEKLRDEVPRAGAGHAHRDQHLRDSRLGARREGRPSARAA